MFETTRAINEHEDWHLLLEGFGIRERKTKNSSIFSIKISLSFIFMLSKFYDVPDFRYVLNLQTRVLVLF